jgi:hypothetical protein
MADVDLAELEMLLEVVRRPERARTSVEERVQLLEDHRRVTELVMAYGWLCDAREWDELLDLYTDDFERFLVGTLDEHLVGKDALRAAYERPVLPRRGGAGGLSDDTRPQDLEIRHMIHPPVVRIDDDGDHAHVAAVYGLVVTSGDGPQVRRGEHEGGYIFELRRVPDVGWRFCRMTVISENARNRMFWGS